MMLLLLVPLFAVLAWVLYEAIAPTLATPTGAKVERDPLEILNLRYARGEVNKTEYARIKKDLS